MGMEPSFKKLSSKDYGRCPKEQNQMLTDLTRPHIESFNYIVNEGLSEAVKHISPVEFFLADKKKAEVFFTDATITSPRVGGHNKYAKDFKLYPAECREQGSCYSGMLGAKVNFMVDGRLVTEITTSLGEIPIMVKSKICNLNDLKPDKLVEHGEEINEMGGYFIVNGNEKVMRMLIMQRRNHPLCITRPSWKKRGPDFTDMGVSIRCCKPDQTNSNLVLHYLSSGAAITCLSHVKEQFFFPLAILLKAIIPVTDHQIYRALTCGYSTNSFYKGCVRNMLLQVSDKGLLTQEAVLDYIGKAFKVKLDLPEWYTNRQAAQYIIENCVLVHLTDPGDKFRLLVHMYQKLFAFAHGQCSAESMDNPANQEILLPGHIYLLVLKEKMENWLSTIPLILDKKGTPSSSEISAAQLYTTCRSIADISRPMEYLLATGNLFSKTGLGLMQASGFTIIADKLNFLRYVSHFRSIHRGAFFSTMRTTTVRKLLPEAWGFLCPVHTPDGTPCGLLNHLTAGCEPVTCSEDSEDLPHLLSSLGMVQGEDLLSDQQYDHSYPVLLDGRLIGRIPQDLLQRTADTLRFYKVTQTNNVPISLEIVPVSSRPGLASSYPGLYLFTAAARMMRPVTNLATGLPEYIGSLEQVYLNICIKPEEAHEGLTTHMELSEMSMFSMLGCLTPFSDFNQSPRNIYQCQMAKQTMGWPCHTFQRRSDNKLYCLSTPQAPMVRPALYDSYDVDDYPLGTNAVVAVISYTGYDMEDAFILNKSAVERGFGYGCLFKSEVIDLRSMRTLSERSSNIMHRFGSDPDDPRTEGRLGADGLPLVGQTLQYGDPYYSYINIVDNKYEVKKYSSSEEAYVMGVKLLGSESGEEELQKICIQLRVMRNPIIGDKFASRHGQKGVVSKQWPVESMPFTDTGVIPDILFNPHGYPSRMTIGMLIESMAGKSAASHGVAHDATPFTFGEDDSAVDYFGQTLVKAGYNYYGTERLYSGITGSELTADIFTGIVYYQRLRHMISDKFQVRTTGPVDRITHQPVKGRKRAGGVRFGEMERDALLSHGASYLLHDRLLLNSDKSKCHMCNQCGSLLTPSYESQAEETAAVTKEKVSQWMCSVCQTGAHIKTMTMPYVFRYLVAELASMSVKLCIEVKEW